MAMNAAIFSINIRSEIVSFYEIDKRIEMLSRAHDFDDEDFVAQYKFLMENVNDNFDNFIKILNESDDDRVLYMTLSIMSSASQTHRNATVDAAANVLLKRDPKYFPVVTKTALGVLGKLDTGKYFNLVKSYESNPNGLIQTAATIALAEIKVRKERNLPSTNSTPTEPLESPLIVSTSSATPTAEAQASSTDLPFIPLAILAAVIVGMVVFLLKRKRP